MQKKISKRYYYLRSLSLNRKHNRHLFKKKEINNRRRKKPSQYINHKKERRFYGPTEKHISAGNSFSLANDPINIIRILNEIEVHQKIIKPIKIKIDLNDVEEIDHGAICLLLAKVNEVLIHKNIDFYGTFPKNDECRRIFIESGVSDYLRDLSGKRFEKRGENLIIRIGSNKTDNEKVGRIIRKAMKFIGGVELHYPPVFSLVQEMCANSVEHSSEIRPNWMFGVVFETDSITNEKSVTFTMTDVGYGILKTLNRKFHMQIREHLSLKTDIDILFSAFEKKYGSKTEDLNRNKGLPLILNRVKKHYVGNVKVITNNVILHLSNYENSSLLRKSLPGTFYSWNVDKKNIESWKQKIPF